MAATNIFQVVLITGVISLFSCGGSVCFKNYHLRGAVSTEGSFLQNDIVTDQPNIQLEDKDCKTPCLRLPKAVKRGGRAALVDLLDYMNKSKPKAEAFAATFTKPKSPTKQGFWETMLYDEK